MSAVVNFKVNVEAIPKEKIFKGKKGSYVNMTMFINDESKFGNNASIAISQSKDEREAGGETTYLGNGAVVFVAETGVTKAEREFEAEVENSAPSDANDLPF